MRWAISCWGSLLTLGEWSLPKTRWRGVLWNVGADGAGVSEVMAACGGGLQTVLRDHVRLVLSGEGTTTLGELHAFTLGLVGARQWFGRRDGQASAHHDSKIS
jgi:hypothetical protein